jgi:hypothetical protein
VADTRYYQDFHFPMPIVDLIMSLLGRKQVTPPEKADSSVREWFSQTRNSTDATTEVVTTTFELPLSVSEMSLEILRMPCTVEVWYQDRSNNWRPVLDMQRDPLSVSVSMSETKSWFKYVSRCYPIVAKQLQFRLTRVADAALYATPFPVGLRNCLIRRNVYDRSSGGAFEDQVDVMGNIITRYIKDWDASKAVDDAYTTFWKSAPIPDPAGVASLFLDVRSASGAAQVVDKVYLDPVYTGQHLNLYYSNDDLVGTRTLSPIALPPLETIIDSGVAKTTAAAESTTLAGSTKTLTDVTKTWTTNTYAGRTLRITDGKGKGQNAGIASNTATTLTLSSTMNVAPDQTSIYQIVDTGEFNMNWRPSAGRYDIASGSMESRYRWPLNVAPQSSQAAWIGVEWRPTFAATGSGLAKNPVLLQSTGTADGTWRPTLSYSIGDNSFRLSFENGVSTAITAPLVNVSQSWTVGESVRIVAGWSYNPKRYFIKVVNQLGVVLAQNDAALSTLPDRISFGPVAQFTNIRGSIDNLVVKLDGTSTGQSNFLANPEYYCDPDPVIRDNSGVVPSTSLDNAIYAAPFLTRQHGSGGADQSHYEDKKWTPIWRDYVAIKGFLNLPSATAMKYLKLEFTNLTEEPYPVYESGIETSYRVFPLSVTQQSSMGPRLYTGTGGFLGLGTFISMNGVRSVNWFNPASVMQAVGAVVGPTTPPVIINTGTPFVTSTMPNQGAQLVEDSRRIEAASSYVYARDAIQPYVLAQNQYTTTIKAEGLQAIQPYVDVPWAEIEAANPGAVTKVKSMGTVPIRGTDWWIYPGQQLKVPASVMLKITDTQTVTERKLTLESRMRFNTVSVHRYDIRTVRRDSAIAYFAGVREVQPYTSSYIAEEDRPSFSFPIYDPLQWTFDPQIVQSVDDKNNPIGPIGIGMPGAATAFKALKTQSDFSKVTLDYQDSGLLVSNSLWASDPSDEANYDRLSPYTSIIPKTDVLVEGTATGGSTTTLVDTSKTWTVNAYKGKMLEATTTRLVNSVSTISTDSWLIASNTATTLTLATSSSYALNNTSVYKIREISGGTWLDVTAKWTDAKATWGSPTGLISATLNPERNYDKRRVLSFNRAADFTGIINDTAEAGINVNQHVNFIPRGLVRMGAVFFKPYTSSNKIKLRLSRTSDNTIIHSETITPEIGKWVDYTTQFVEIPPTLSNGTFSVGTLTGWTGAGSGNWTQDNTNGHAGLGSAKVVKGSGEHSLTTEKMKLDLGGNISCSAWVKWSGVTASGTGPAIVMQALYYQGASPETATLVDTKTLTDTTITDTHPTADVAVYSPASASSGWVPIGGTIYVPSNAPITYVAFRITAASTVASGATVWVDDVLADVPGADRQTYSLSLTVVGNDRDTLYLSDLRSDIAPIRYFVQLGGTGSYLQEVTDLRYTASDTIVTASPPVHDISLYTTILSPKARARSLTVTPTYLR